jgi:molybdopterin-guanine dinucleotide biosynthesis protein A
MRTDIAVVILAGGEGTRTNEDLAEAARRDG